MCIGIAEVINLDILPSTSASKFAVKPRATLDTPEEYKILQHL